MNVAADPRWLDLGGTVPFARVALLCLPYAGGSAAVFRRWWPLLPADVLPVGVELPGRGRRFGEPLTSSADEVVGGVQAALTLLGDLPLAVFGHSMGARLGFELVRRLVDERPVAAFIASGCPAPQLPSRVPAISHLPEPDFLPAAWRWGLAGEGLRRYADLAALFAPVLRADLRLVETIRHRPGPPVPVRTVVVGGDADPLVNRAELTGWAELVTPPPEVHELPGGHLYLVEQQAAVLALICAALAG